MTTWVVVLEIDAGPNAPVLDLDEIDRLLEAAARDGDGGLACRCSEERHPALAARERGRHPLGARRRRSLTRPRVRRRWLTGQRLASPAARTGASGADGRPRRPTTSRTTTTSGAGPS